MVDTYNFIPATPRFCTSIFICTSQSATIGYFIEIDCGDGYIFSNTCKLEEQFGWQGPIVEPSPENLSTIAKHRCCTVDNRCAWNTNRQELQFREMEMGEHTWVIGFSRAGDQDIMEDVGATIAVQSVTLSTLLTE